MPNKPLFPATKEIGIGGRFAHLDGMLKNWVFLTSVWSACDVPPTTKELKQLIIAESEGRKRPYMLKRLIARLHIVERETLFKKLKLS